MLGGPMKKSPLGRLGSQWQCQSFTHASAASCEDHVCANLSIVWGPCLRQLLYRVRPVSAPASVSCEAHVVGVTMPAGAHYLLVVVTTVSCSCGCDSGQRQLCLSSREGSSATGAMATPPGPRPGSGTCCLPLSLLVLLLLITNIGEVGPKRRAVQFGR